MVSSCSTVYIPFRMDEQFRKKVIENLWKSGFGSELKAIKAFDERKAWSAGAGSSFFDPVLNISRSLDLTAYRHGFAKKGQDFLFNVSVSLFGEVKKSEKPWTVLRSSPWATPELPFLTDAIIRSTGPVPVSAIQSALAKGCIISTNKWFGHAVHEVFKEPNEHGRWFEAAAKTCRASLAASQRPFIKFQDDTWVVDYIQPVVILDGHLLAAALDDTMEMLLEEIPFASIRFEERGREASKAAFVVDLVKLAALPAYIDRIECGFAACFQVMTEYKGGTASDFTAALQRPT